MQKSLQAVSMPTLLALICLCAAPGAYADDSSADTGAGQAHEAYTAAINSNSLESVVAK